MIDCCSVSGVNDTAASHNKVDLHMVDTFAAVCVNFSEDVMSKEKPVTE